VFEETELPKMHFLATMALEVHSDPGFATPSASLLVLRSANLQQAGAGPDEWVPEVF
jgi:hypothetical protein